MKHFRFLCTPFFAVMFLILTSCGENKDKAATDSVSNDSTTAEPAMETKAVEAPVNIMLAKHKVANFAKWKASYEARDSLRLANGIHSFVIGRGVPDSNTVLVAVKVEDVAKAKAFSKDPELKKAMQQGGVVGAPTFMFLTVPFLETADAGSNLRAMSTMTVKDWDVWRKSFESNKQLRIDNGLRDRAYGHDVDDNHIVTVVMTITDTAKANAFIKSDILQQKREESGVVSKPDRFMYKVVQTY